MKQNEYREYPLIQGTSKYRDCYEYLTTNNLPERYRKPGISAGTVASWIARLIYFKYYNNK